VTPHHLSLTDDACAHYDTAAKCNPPLRGAGDAEALREGLRDGTIDAIATDHAPHSSVEKDVEFEQAAFGMIGLETALPLAAGPGARRRADAGNAGDAPVGGAGRDLSPAGRAPRRRAAGRRDGHRPRGQLDLRRRRVPVTLAKQPIRGSPLARARHIDHRWR